MRPIESDSTHERFCPASASSRVPEIVDEECETRYVQLTVSQLRRAIERYGEAAGLDHCEVERIFNETLGALKGEGDAQPAD